MNAEAWFVVLEVEQALVAMAGFTVACLEWRSIWRLQDAWETEGQRILARHALFVELLRCSVHVAILGTAGISLSLPAPPEEMPHWIAQALVVRKVGFLWIALIATAGTVSSRNARKAFARVTGR